jgi:hypothetical protein
MYLFFRKMERIFGRIPLLLVSFSGFAGRRGANIENSQGLLEQQGTGGYPAETAGV